LIDFLDFSQLKDAQQQGGRHQNCDLDHWLKNSEGTNGLMPGDWWLIFKLRSYERKNKRREGGEE
jgi:hypothetical protein